MLNTLQAGQCLFLFDSQKMVTLPLFLKNRAGKTCFLLSLKLKGYLYFSVCHIASVYFQNYGTIQLHFETTVYTSVCTVHIFYLYGLMTFCLPFFKLLLPLWVIASALALFNMVNIILVTRAFLL